MNQIDDIIKSSNSQAGQDVFAYYICDTNNGYFIDIGSGTPIGMNNTYLLEKNGWNGLNFDFWDNRKSYEESRRTPYIMEDVNKINMSNFLEKMNSPKVVDYLSIDIDENTDYFLSNNFPTDYEFKVITFEHNLYLDGDSLKNKSKNFFIEHGYTLLCENVALSFTSKYDVFEDWYINEKYIDIKKFEFLKSCGLHFTEIINKIKEHELNNIKICLYTMCINEEEFLPFFLDYYTNYVGVDKIVIYDGGSTDKSHSIINSYPNTELILEHDDKTDSFRDLRIWNEEWKKCRNDYDWMIVCTPDEFLYHPDLRNKLIEYKKNGITIPNVEGFDMISLNHPNYDKGNYLPNQIKRGIKDSTFLNKNIIFNPKEIDINYHVGCHGCNPTGNIKFSEEYDFKLLHYKWISYDFLMRDSKRKYERLSDKMLETGAGGHYKVFIQKTYEEYVQRYNQTIQVLEEEKDINLFWHCYLINNWVKIFKNQLNKIVDSGLYEKLNTIHLHYFGKPEEVKILSELISRYDKIKSYEIEDNFYEYPTIKHIHKFSSVNNSYVGYIHLKGVWSSMNKEKNIEAINSWRKCLEYFNIEKWDNCISKINEGYEVVGALYNYNEKDPLFSGNFWWTTTDYIKKLKYPQYDPSKNPYPMDDGTWCRVECEKWINTIPNKFYNFYIPKDYGFYQVPIDENDYKDKKTINHIYENIEGWFDFEKIYSDMVNRFPNGSHFVEIGSWLGKSTSYMGAEISNSGKKIKFDSIDTWEGSKGSWDEQVQNDTINNLNISLYQKFLENVRPVKDYINPIQGWSYDVVNRYEDKSLDFVFIDGAHDYESVKKDINDWYPKVKDNGVIAGHDYNIHDWPGVVQAVNEFFNEGNVSSVKKDTWSWIVDKKEFEDSKQKNHKISIIIPTYNRPDILTECINSVLKQNYENLEILICHDGFFSEFYCYDYKTTDKRIFYYNTDNQYNNLGAAQRNMMISKVTGDYILFLDDDNILYDGYLQKMIEQIDKNTGMVVCRIHFNDKEWLNLILPPDDRLIPAKIDHLSILFKSDIAKKFTWDNDWGQDHRFINNCERLCNEKGFEIKYIPNILANHRYLKRENRIDELLKEKRLEQYDDDNGVNRLFGLKNMIDENLNKESIICEVGSFDGKSSELFALLTKKVYCVDPWVLYSQIDDESMIKSEEKFDKLLNKYNNIIKIKNYSIEASKTFENEFLDCVYIDGNHDYEPVKQDILHWIPKIKRGGFISGHDYHFEGVRKSLNELFQNIPIKVYSDQSWVVKINDYRKGEKPHKEVVIMTSHPNYKMSEDITKLAINSFDNKDVILSVHCPVSIELQNKVKYLLYDKNNPLIRHDYYNQSWFETTEYYSLIKLHYNDNDFQHALAVYINYYNGIMYAKSLGYTTAICTNFDIVFSKEDLKIVDEKISEMYQSGKKSFFMTSNPSEGIHYKTIFFITDVDFFLNNFKYVTNEKDYNKLTREVGSETNCLENFFYETLKNSDKLLLQQIEEKELFSKSKVNMFSNIEYFTILPLRDDNEHFVIWFSSANSIDNRSIGIHVLKGREAIFSHSGNISKDYKFYKEIKFEKDCNYEVICNVYYDDMVNQKTITVNNDVFYNKLKDYGDFWKKSV